MDEDWDVSLVDLGSNLGYMFVDTGYALPPKFEMLATRGELQARIAVRVIGERAIVAKLSITSGAAGVTTAELRSIPLREIVAKGARELLSRADPSGHMESGFKHDKRSLAAVRKAVGYVKVPR